MIDEDTEAIVIRTAAALAEVLELALDVMQHGPPFDAKQRRGARGVLDVWYTIQAAHEA